MSGSRSLDHEPSGARGSFRHVLAICNLTDSDEATLRAAARLARVYGARLDVLTVVELPPATDYLFRRANLSRAEVERRLVDESRQGLQDLVGRIADGLSARIEVKLGKPFMEIIKHVLAHDHDLVVKTAEDLEEMPHRLSASTDQHLLRKCPTTLWLRRAISPAASNTVLAAVAINEFAASEPATQKALNQRIIEIAARLTVRPDGRVHVLNVWEAPGEGLVRLWSNQPGDERAWEYVAELEAQHRQWMGELLGEMRQKLHRVGLQEMQMVQHLKRGTPSAEIARQARMLKADTLVIGTIARTGLPGLLIGNTAEDVLNRVETSVVAVKPPGYVSPIRL